MSHSALQAVIIISIIIAVGLALGKIRVWGISLGVTFVFFAGILAGHIGLSIDPTILHYTENLGLVLFVYELGLKVGPGFFSSFRKGGMQLNLLGLGVIVIGTLMAVLFSIFLGVPIGEATGLLCGATTNTPALGAAQQALEQLGRSANGAALSCAVTYPLGVVGVILAIIALRKTLIRPGTPLSSAPEETDSTFIAEFKICNPAIYDMSVREITSLTKTKFVISRLWRNEAVLVPDSSTILHKDDHLLVITTQTDCPKLKVLFGKQEARDWNKKDIDWNSIDNQLISRRIIVSRSSINGKKLGSLRLRNQYHINISRITRSGLHLVATPELILQLGDTLTVVGSAADIEKVEQTLGNSAISSKIRISEQSSSASCSVWYSARFLSQSRAYRHQSSSVWPEVRSSSAFSSVVSGRSSASSPTPPAEPTSCCAASASRSISPVSASTQAHSSSTPSCVPKV